MAVTSAQPARPGGVSIHDLREAPECLPQLAHWHHEEWSWFNPAVTLQARIASLGRHLSPGLLPSTFVARLGDQLLGSASLVANDLPSKPAFRPWLAGLYVAAPFRRQGVGAQLVRHGMRLAAHAGHTRLFLFTLDKHSFYEALGWEVIGTETLRDRRIQVMRVSLAEAGANKQ